MNFWNKNGPRRGCGGDRREWAPSKLAPAVERASQEVSRSGPFCNYNIFRPRATWRSSYRRRRRTLVPFSSPHSAHLYTTFSLYRVINVAAPGNEERPLRNFCYTQNCRCRYPRRFSVVSPLSPPRELLFLTVWEFYHFAEHNERGTTWRSRYLLHAAKTLLFSFARVVFVYYRRSCLLTVEFRSSWLFVVCFIAFLTRTEIWRKKRNFLSRSSFKKKKKKICFKYIFLQNETSVNLR